MDRRQVYMQRIGKECPERRKQLFDRRQHHGMARIFFISWRRLVFEFADIRFF